MNAQLAKLQQQLKRAPDDPELHYELGRYYLQSKQASAAETAFQRALQLVPEHPQILMQLGNVASLRGDETLAAIFFKRSLAQDNQQADVHFNLANSLRKLGQTSLAIQHYQQSLRLDPQDAECHNNLGNAYREQGQLDQAVAAYARALQLNPKLLHAQVHWIHQKQHMADWEGLEQAITEVRDALQSMPQAQIPPFAFLAMPGTTDQEQLTCASRWAQQHYGHIQPFSAPAPKAADARIKLAYLSSDFRKHPLAYLVTEVIATHQREQFEVFLYSNSNNDQSAEWQAFHAAADHWVEISDMTDEAVAQHMRAADIDLLIDLTGFTQRSRSGVAAYKPARQHINWLGYPGSLGVVNGRSLYDAIIVDDTLAEVALAEQKIVLPCYQPNNARRPVADPGSRESHGLPAQGFVFCCFNQSFKITPEVFACWMRILKQVPGSVLWLLESNAWAAKHLTNAAISHGVASERLIFAPRTTIEQHIARQQHADLMLDTAPYNAHTTASDALWQGIPLLTVQGATFPARVSASLLKQLSLQDCICPDWHAFEQSAVMWAQSLTVLASIKLRLQNNAGKLFSPETFCRQLEQAYAQLLLSAG